MVCLHLFFSEPVSYNESFFFFIHTWCRFMTQNVRDATATSELVHSHEAIRAETADAALKLKDLAIDDEKLVTWIR